MDETKGFALINRAVNAAIAIDVLLLFGTVANPEPFPVASCLGAFVAQCGLCCAAFLRNDNMREEALSFFVVLITVGFLVAAFGSEVEAGYVVLAVFVGTMIGTAVHLVPVWMLWFFLGRKRPQFSILKVMIVTALFGALAGFARWGGELALLAGVIALIAVLIFLPSALACWLLNFTQRTVVFLSTMLVVSAIVIGLAAWIPEWDPVAGFLLAQTSIATIGGVILLQVKPSSEPISQSKMMPPNTPPFDFE